MATNNPLDDSFIKLIDNLQSRVENLERARQPILLDWIELGANKISSNTSGVLTFPSGYDTQSAFRTGDRLRLTDSGAVKYGYVIDVSVQGQITIYGGSDYIYTNNLALTNVAYSRSPNPSGFPHFFNYLPTYTNALGANTIIVATNTSNYESFYMLGNRIDVFISHASFSLSGTVANQIGLQLPIPINFSLNFAAFSSFKIYDTYSTPANNPGSGLNFIIGGLSILWLGKIDGSSFGYFSGNAIVQPQGSASYFI